LGIEGGPDYDIRLELGVGVRANFAVKVDYFMLRGCPFHGRRSFGGYVKRNEESVSQTKGEGNPKVARETAKQKRRRTRRKAIIREQSVVARLLRL
jgi:hypothetical protein